jgi:hypothetical protein
MPLPELRTGGVDVTNTLARIAALKRAEIQEQQFNRQLNRQEAELPGILAERESANALRTLQAKKLRIEEAREKVNDAVKAVAWVKGHPNPAKAYDTAYKKYTAEGVATLPEPSVFLSKDEEGNEVFDVDKFSKFADAGINAMKVQLDPKEGTRFGLDIKNPDFDSTKEVSDDNPRMITKYFVVKNGIPVADTELPVVPTTSKIEKEKREEKSTERREKHMDVVEKLGEETKALESRRLTLAEKREARETEKQKEKDKPKFKSFVTNPETKETFGVFSDGSIKAVDEDGNWTAATKVQIDGIKKLGTDKPKSAVEQWLESKKSETTEKKPSKPTSRQQAFDALKLANPSLADAVINTYIDTKYPGLK